MPRRANGEGNIRRKPDGRWEASIMLNGRRYWTSASAQSLVRTKLDDIKRRHQTGSLVEPRALTLSSFLDLWLEAGRADWKPRTLVGYESLLENYWRPQFGHVRLQRLTAPMLAAAYAQWRDERDVTGGTLLNVHRCIHRALRVAVLWGFLPSNPADRVEPPKARRRRPNLWSIAQLQVFLRSGAHEDPWGTLWYLLIGSGCRLGEALALRWTDVDFEAGAITIERNASWVRGERLVVAPKTPAGRRTVQLPQHAIARLRQWNECQVAKPTDNSVNGYVFTLHGGKLPSPDHVRTAFRRACNRANVPVVRVHDLRHLSASLLLSEGLPLPALSRRLGHANTAVTASTYAHAIHERDAAVAMIERALDGLPFRDSHLP